MDADLRAALEELAETGDRASYAEAARAAAQRLGEPALSASLVEALEFARLRAPALELSLAWFEAKCVERERESEGELIKAWLTAAEEHLDITDLERLSNRMAWATRGLTPGTPPSMINTQLVSDQYLFLLYLQRARFLFQPGGIKRYADPIIPTDEGLRVISDSMKLLANALDPDCPGSVEGGVELAWAMARDTGLASPVADICLQALAVSSDRNDSTVALLRYSDKARAERLASPSVVSYRRAFANLGLRNLEAAREDVDRALASISGGPEFIRVYSQQCVELRWRISEAIAVEESIRVAESDLDGLRDEVRGVEGNTVARIVEIVTLFTAAIAFISAGVTTATRDGLTTGDRVAVILGVASGLATFSVLVVASLVYLTYDRSYRNQQLPWGRYFAVVFAAISLQIIGAGAIVLIEGQ